MKIALFTELFPPHMGGQEVRFAELAQSLVAQGHQVRVYCIAHDAKLPKQELVDGVDVRRLVRSPKYTSPLLRTRRSLATMVGFAFAARRAALEWDYDLALYNQWPLLHVLTIPRALRTRAVLDWCEVREGLPWRTIQTFLPRLVGNNVGVSSSVAASIEASSGRTTATLPSGVHRASYASRPREDRGGIVYVGRVAKHKRLPLLLDTFCQLVDRGYDGDLVIAGAGPDAEVVAERNRWLPAHVQQRVRLMGHVTEEEKRGLLASAKVLVVPSEREGFPRVVAEAMASSLPVVTTDDSTNGTANVVREFNCGLTARATPDGLADAIQELESRWDEYSARAYEGSASLDWAALIGTMTDMSKQKKGSWVQ